MARKRKPSDNEQGNEQMAAPNGSAEEPVVRKRRAPRRKTSASKQPAPTAEFAAAQSDAAPTQLSDDAVRLRAYFISEERTRNAIPGNAEADWLEARRQLLAEAGLG